MNTALAAAVRELDRRTNDGFDVRLLWDSRTNRVFVAVDDQRQGDSFALEVDAADALEAFYHPFTYPSADHGPRSRPDGRLPAQPSLAPQPQREPRHHDSDRR